MESHKKQFADMILVSRIEVHLSYLATKRNQLCFFISVIKLILVSPELIQLLQTLCTLTIVGSTSLFAKSGYFKDVVPICLVAFHF